MSDFKIVVEYRDRLPNGKLGGRFRNDFETMYDMMNHVYSVMHTKPNVEIKVWKEWDFGANRQEK